MTVPSTTDVPRPAPDERELVAELTRDALAVVAPEELRGFAAHQDTYLDGGRPDQPDADGQLAVGLELVAALTPYVVAAATAAVKVLAAAIADKATSEATSALKSWVRRLLHKDGDTRLPADVVDRVHEATLQVCRDLGADELDARLVADAVSGRLATA